MTEEIKILAESIQNTAQQGRQTLVVLGAGCSVTAGVPQMRQVYQYLYEKTLKLSLDFPEKRQGKELAAWLDALKNGAGPRSAAARALGTLQRAYDLTNDEFSVAMQGIWQQFSSDFIACRILKNTPSVTSSSFVKQNGLLEEFDNHQPNTGEPQASLMDLSPTPFHDLVAQWVLSKQAIAVSVNFDGLTRKAIRNRIKGQNADCVVLSSPTHVEKFYLGEESSSIRDIYPVIKVWGDVFHAVCQNRRCPDSGVQVPIYGLEVKSEDDEENKENRVTGSLRCTECGEQRQLQVFFTGYQEKEQDTERLMHSLWQFVAPRVGNIIVAGLSGIWDDALVNFIGKLASDLEAESGQSKIFCLDTNENVYVAAELRRRNIQVTPILSTSDKIASDLAELTVKPSVIASAGYAGRCRPTAEEFWQPLLIENEISNKVPHGYSKIAAPDYLNEFANLRQLGLKTRLHISGNKEQEHNRLKHSLGASHLAWYWVASLLQKPDIAKKLTNLVPAELLKSLAVLAAAHHDIGHIPFTHLAEEVFDEVHWSLRDNATHYRHDDHLFDATLPSLYEQAADTIKSVAKSFNIDSSTLQQWIACIIEGRSGIPLLDAVINSPLDVDKIDYVFRDCKVLQKAIHLPLEDEQRLKWVRDFVNNQQEVLPSGLIALSGTAGEHARDLLEERRWLYKYFYFGVGYRVVERIARSILTLWLLHKVPDFARPPVNSVEAFKLSDTRALKGLTARNLLWKRLEGLGVNAGEAELLLSFATDLQYGGISNLPMASQAIDWIKACNAVLQPLLGPQDDKWRDYDKIMEELQKKASWSEKLYIRFQDLKKVNEIARRMETAAPFTAMIDIALMPRMLAHPKRRRFNVNGKLVMGECYAVSDNDPDRWGRQTGHWVPLSTSAYAEKDQQRWAQILIISPYEPKDPNVRYFEDRFRHLCQQENITILNEDPDNIGVTKIQIYD